MTQSPARVGSGPSVSPATPAEHTDRDAAGQRDVTVVIATRNRRRGAQRTVRRLLALPQPPLVIVVDDGSTDGTAAAIRAEFAAVTVLRAGGRGSHGATIARNAGVRAATTPYVAFCDDDSWWAPGALEKAARHIAAHPRLGLLAARILVGEDERLDPMCRLMAAGPLPSAGLPGPRILGFVACGAVVRRDAFLQAGGFPEDYVIGGEEQPLTFRLLTAGWETVYAEDVVAHHAPDEAADRRGRGRNQTRNDLWTAWCYRRGAGIVSGTAAALRGATTVATLAGLAQALLQLPALRARRRPVPWEIERQRRMLDAAAPVDADRTAPACEPHTPPSPWLTAAARGRIARGAVNVLAHHRPEPRVSGDPRVAVVVITHNRVEELLENLGRLADLPERPHVVVADNASTDGTSAAVRARHPWVEVVQLDRNAGAIGRNVAVDMLPHPYIAFADDDSWWDPGSLRRAADVLDAHPDVAVVTARIIVEPAGVEDPVVADMRHSPLRDATDLPGRPLLSFLAGASVVRRTAFKQVGGFEPRLWLGGEEELLSADLVAAGWRLRYIPDLTVHHAASSARDPHRRRADGLRNTLWCTWLRRPLVRALWRSLALLRRAPHDRVTATAVAAALAGVPWVLWERHLLPPAVERQFRLLDHHQLSSPARRYVS